MEDALKMAAEKGYQLGTPDYIAFLSGFLERQDADRALLEQVGARHYADDRSVTGSDESA